MGIAAESDALGAEDDVPHALTITGRDTSPPTTIHEANSRLRVIGCQTSFPSQRRLLAFKRADALGTTVGSKFDTQK